VRFAALLSLVAIGCGSARTHVPPGETDYGRPFEIVLAKYTVPVAMGLANPGSVGGWDEKPAMKTFVQGFTHGPRATDVDTDFVNYVLHPLAGSETHVIARAHGWTFWEAFLFDVFGSVAWEYVFENLFERPSRTDLVVTAPLGAILGELRWQAAQAGILPGVLGPSPYDPFLEWSEDHVVVGVRVQW